jgi:molybdopterin molybdotransferase
VLSTGDELVEIGTKPGPGQIINSNSLSIAAAVKEAGAAPRMLGVARDNRISHLEKLRQGLSADCLITSAGASAGDRDLVRAVLEELGVKFLFSKVAMKPGKPTAFGIWEGRPVFCLPGNPVASQITFEMLVRPALLKMQGHRKVVRPTVTASLQESLKSAGRMQCLRVSLQQQGNRYFVTSSGNQETGTLRTSLLSDTLALLPANTSFNTGDEVRVLLPANQLVEP